MTNTNFKSTLFEPIYNALGGLRVLYTAITNIKLYNRWCRIQNIRFYKNKDSQEAMEKAELEKAIRESNIKKFALRRKPKLLEFYKLIRSIERIILKILGFLVKAICIIIAIIIVCHIFGWFCNNPIWLIVFLLLMILIKG